MQKNIHSLLFIGLTILCGPAWATPGVYATYTVNVATMAMKDSVQHCATIVPLKPDSVVITYYDDHTFQDVFYQSGLGPSAVNGTWGEMAIPITKVREDFTGNMGDRSGSWGDMLGAYENEAQTACGGVVTADGATFRVTKLEAVFKVPSGACSGTATSTFIMSGYGVNTITGLTVKMSYQVNTSGTLVLGPSAGC